MLNYIKGLNNFFKGELCPLKFYVIYAGPTIIRLCMILSLKEQEDNYSDSYKITDHSVDLA